MRHVGLILFVVYAAAYAAFVLLNAFHGRVMVRTAALGVNLAVVYGMALIIGAFIVAALYCWAKRGEGENA